MITEKKNRKLKKDVFRLVSGIENEKNAEREVLALLGLKRKHSLSERKFFNKAEKLAIEAVFEKYGVIENIWDDGNSN